MKDSEEQREIEQLLACLVVEDAETKTTTQDLALISFTPPVLDVAGNRDPRGRRWRCDSKYRNRLMWDGSPLEAQSLEWLCENIRWDAGWGIEGGPIITDYCWVPHRKFNLACYPEAFLWQIVPEFGKYWYSGCENPGRGNGRRRTEVYFTVNDDQPHYTRHIGYFDVIVLE